MIYLSIPEGMEFKQRKNDQGILSDYFIDPTGAKPDIDIRSLVKQTLRTNTHRKKTIETDYFTIYLKKPPYSAELFLRYQPCANGKWATEGFERVSFTAGKEVFTKSLTEVVPGTSVSSKSYFNPHSRNLWWQETALREARLTEVLEARYEQRENRRHMGDCPNPT